MKKINFFITLLFAVLSLSVSVHAQNETQEVGVSTNLVADSLQDSLHNLIELPPCSWQEGVILTKNGWVIMDYDYWEFYASSLEEDYLDFPQMGYIGNMRHHEDGSMVPMRDKEADKKVLVYDPRKNKKKYKLRKFNMNRIFEVWINMTESNKFLPGIGVTDGTIKKEEMIDNKLPGKQHSYMYGLRPQKINETERYEEIK